ncbi:MAG TPA: methylated-DNA--[protein]-cysteine S-methyltransferase [Gemmatimonadaceae bacterium]|nr:methylated-DNA--[protein]-cysteine S-methyltransferase [Gemmatimonadaceae bacterium]
MTRPNARATVLVMTVYDILPTPVGALLLAAEEAGLTVVAFEPHEGRWAPAAEWRRVGHDAGDESDAASRVLAEARAQLAAYFAGERTTFTVPLAPRGTPFQRRVWLALRAIPHGETISYLELARRVGDPRAVRAVGGANGRNPLPVIVPCHRVIGADGSLTGFGGGIERKRWLLEHEGARLAGAAASHEEEQQQLAL